MSNIRPPFFLVKIANGKNAALFALLFFCFSMGIMPMLEADIMALSNGVGVIDLQPFYTPAKVNDMLQAYGSEGRQLYLQAEWTADLIFPLIGCFLFSTLLIWLGAKRWWWLGIAMMLADWMENVSITLLLVKFPVFPEWIAWTSCAFTMTKWLCLGCSVSLILFYAGKKITGYFSGASPVEARH